MTWLGTNTRALFAAGAFLTRLPVGRLVTFDGDDVARAGLYFPVVGAGLGALAGAIAQALEPRLSGLLAAAIAVGVTAAATGALHLDAIADTADALGGRDREHALAIMRDHAIGAYGAVALITDLALRTTALAALSSRHHAVVVALAAGALSRATAPVTGSLLPYARAGDGKGAATTRSSPARAGGAVLLASGAAIGAGGTTGAAMLGVAAAATGALALCWRRWLGGVTGDTLGAGIEVTELLALIAGVALVSPRVGG